MDRVAELVDQYRPVVIKELCDELHTDEDQVEFVLHNHIDTDSPNGIYFRYYERLDELVFGREESA